MKKQPLLDLHGYKVEDVADAVDRFLVQSQRKGSPRVRIMTGKGTGQVKKAVMEYLKLGGYPYEFERMENGARNEGVLVVILED
jgi:DNA-nicking Smr family endonuclease